MPSSTEPTRIEPWLSAEAADQTDRQVSQLISLGGVALILGQAGMILSGIGLFPPWWELPALLLLTQILAFAAFGWALPMRWLRAGWTLAPIVNAVLLLSAYGAYRGPLPVTSEPWLWAFEAAIVSYLVLTIPPRWAVAGTVASALLPLVSALAFLGEVPHVVLTQTPIHGANMIYIALFSGIRTRLNRLREAEARALAAEAQQVRAQVTAHDKEQLARLIHDEVLSVLVSATNFRGAPPAALRTDAFRALALFDRPTLQQDSGSLATGVAADRLMSALRQVDAGIAIDSDAGDGEVPCAVVEAIAAAAAEALRNSVRHAGAAERHVTLSVFPRAVEATVHDQGPGFDIGQVADHHLGIRCSVQQRMRTLPGGDAAVDSAPGAGTKVRLTWHA
ncbi:MAG: ATP-binding protein [Nigerium sp.]|nr:ATP-binding protein [Nigerium sp.]